MKWYDPIDERWYDPHRSPLLPEFTHEEQRRNAGNEACEEWRRDHADAIWDALTSTAASTHCSETPKRDP